MAEDLRALRDRIYSTLATHPQYQRDLAAETTGSLVYRAADCGEKPK